MSLSLPFLFGLLSLAATQQFTIQQLFDQPHHFHQLPSLLSRQCDTSVPEFTSQYHAPARSIPSPPVDSQLKREFLNLFHRDLNQDHNHVDPHDSITNDTAHPSLIDPAIIAQINANCPRDAFFYSFAPRHMNATMLLQQVFLQQRTPADVLRIAKGELFRHEINPKVWFVALLNAILQRPDMSGYNLAYAVDAQPDYYIPSSILDQATEGSSRPRPNLVSDQCTTAIGVLTTDIRQRQPGQEQQQQQQQPNQQPAQPQSFIPQTQALFRAPPQQFQQRQRQLPSPQPPQFTPVTDQAFFRAQQHLRLSRQRGKRQTSNRRCVPYNGTTGATGQENLLWYFREDVQVNQHHWYWHEYYPQTTQRHPERRGESFYFMHHNLVARYNAERLSNGLSRETPLDFRLNGNIGPGYNSDLVDKQSGRFWQQRFADMPLSDITHGGDPDFQVNFTMNQLTNIYNTISSHSRDGYLIGNRTTGLGQPWMEFQINIRSQEGLNTLGNTAEAAEERLNVNPNLYHNFGIHNLAHVSVALATDPDFRCQRVTGVMADATTTMRDPAFYKVHSLLDDLFDQYKAGLGPYSLNGGEFPLVWDGVRITGLETVPPIEVQGIGANLVRTFWETKRFPLEEGVDGNIHDGDVETDICHQHLNHEPFVFRLTIDVNNCVQSNSSMGTVRIFMAPRLDFNGRRFTMDESRRLMFQLDAFPVELRRGRNIITRASQDSSSTKPWTRSLEEMLRDPDNGGRAEYCGCGWPSHLYLPKGTAEGMQFDLFAMITNYDQDQVQETQQNLRTPEPCLSPYLFCGIPFRRYPDARPMGYPFDRPAHQVIDVGQTQRPLRDLEEYVAHVPNARSSVLVIQHLNTRIN